jgi:energy-coupling factor transporter ATP-binding protein EcfA2
MMRLIAHLGEHPDFYELEGAIFDDRLDVTMYDNGRPKKVETLSKGQKATALLPLILRPAPYPLVVDQPEDDLDNSFIYQSLVKVIRKLKTERQLIFVTHNANIPVLGDAERVIVMSMTNPLSAASPQSGTVDDRKSDVLDLLEGGKEAFQERERHYAELLGNQVGK